MHTDSKYVKHQLWAMQVACVNNPVQMKFQDVLVSCVWSAPQQLQINWGWPLLVPWCFIVYGSISKKKHLQQKESQETPPPPVSLSLIWTRVNGHVSLQTPMSEALDLTEASIPEPLQQSADVSINTSLHKCGQQTCSKSGTCERRNTCIYTLSCQQDMLRVHECYHGDSFVPRTQRSLIP